MSPPCVGGRAGGALAKNLVDSQRRAPSLGSGGHPLPRRCAPGHPPAARPPALQSLRRGVELRSRSGVLAGSRQDAPSLQSGASAPGAALWPPAATLSRASGRRALSAAPALPALAYHSSALSRGLTSSSRRKVLSRPGGKRPSDGERAAARPPSAAGHVEGESRLLPRDAGSPSLLLPPPAPLAPLTLTRGFTLASKPAPRPSRAAGAASTQAATDVGGARAAQPTACAAPTWGTDACRPQPVLSFAPPTSRGLCALSPRLPACAPPPPARPVRSECRGARGAAGRPRQPMGSELDAEIGKPLPKVGGKESGGPGCQSK